MKLYSCLILSRDDDWGVNSFSYGSVGENDCETFF